MAVERPSITLRRSPCATFPFEHRSAYRTLGLRRRVVHEALGGDRCADPLVDDPGDLEVPVALAEPDLDPIAHLDLGGGLGR